MAEAFAAAALTNSTVVVGRRLSTGGWVVETLSLPDLARAAMPVQLTPALGMTLWEGLAISPAGDRFVTTVVVPGYWSVTLWDGTGTMLATRKDTERAPTVVFSPDGGHILMTDTIVNARTGAVERVLPNRLPYPPVMLNSDGTRVAAVATLGATEDISVPTIYEAASGVELRVFATLTGVLADPFKVMDMSMSADGQLLAISQPRNLMLFRIDPRFAKSSAIQSASRCELPFRVSLSRDGQRLLCSGDGLSLSRTFTGEVDETVPPPDDVRSDGCLWSLGSLSPSATWLVTGSRDGLFNIRPTQHLSDSGKAVQSLRCNGRAVFNADESLMATTGPELYRTSDWTRIWPPIVVPPVGRESESPYGDVQFLPGGRELLISSCGYPLGAGDWFSPCNYTLYSAETGHTVRELPALTGYKAAVSAEGHWIVSGATLQHLPTDTLRTLELDGQQASMSIFTPDGDIIATMPDNTLVRYCRSDRAP